MEQKVSKTLVTEDTVTLTETDGSDIELVPTTEVPGLEVEEDSFTASSIAGEFKRTEAEQAEATRHEALALGSIDIDEAANDPSLIFELFETRGYVRRAPRFHDQIQDDTRTKPFKFLRKVSRRGTQIDVTSESEGLHELHSFLEAFVSKADQDNDSNQVFIDQAKSMLENLTFIGDKEYQEAARGLGMYWKQYLDGDPSRTLCVLADIGKLGRYRTKGKRKSDEFLRDQILQTFTDEELERYSGRIVGSLEDLPADPENARVILLDDWTISGSQIRSVYKDLATHPSFERYISAGNVEVNLITTSEDRLQGGLYVNPYNDAVGKLKVRSYFMSHHAAVAQKEHKGHITGLHSSVNYDFSLPVKYMWERLRKQKLADPVASPALMWVMDAYESPQRILITGDRLVRLEEDGEVSNESK